MDSGNRHTYDYDVDTSSDTAPAHVIRMVGRDKRVVEVGCGPGAVTKVLHQNCHCRITAFELDPNAIELVAPYCEKVFQADLNDVSWSDVLKNERFDVAVAADVLEHVYNPLSVLGSMKKLLNDTGYLVVSLPHAGHNALLACLMNGDLEYRDWGLLDRTHIRFFGIKNMQQLFEQAGLKITGAEFVIRHPEVTEFAHQWRAISKRVKNVLLSNSFGLVYQVVIQAVPFEREGHPISLMELCKANTCSAFFSTPQTFWHEYLKAKARQHLSPDMRKSIRSFAERLGLKI